MGSFAQAQDVASTNRPARSLTLDESIRLAVEHNLDVQVGRYNPVIVAYQLAGSYAVYDPILNVAADQRVSSRQGQFDPQSGFLTADTESTVNSLRPTVSGYLPTGLRYSLNGTFSHSDGTAGSFGAPFDNYNTFAGFSGSQPLLRNFWTDAERTAIQVAKKDLKISELLFEDQLRQLVLLVQQAYYNLIASAETITARRKALELAEALVAQNREKVRVGVLAPLDEKQAESQAAIARADLFDALRVAAEAENTLKILITDRYEEWHPLRLETAERLIAVPQSYNLQESWTAAFTRRPDYKAAAQEIERQELQVKYRHNQLFPELNAVGGYGREGLSQLTRSNSVTIRDSSFNESLDAVAQGLNPSWNFGAVLRMPFTFRNERYNYKQARADKERLELVQRQNHQQILVQVDNAVARAKTSFERVSATHEARLYAEAALEAEQKKLDNGKSTTFEVLRLQRDLTSARLQEIEALRDYNNAVAQLHSAEGTNLERNRISIRYQ
jgi:HAE1 family hydrophobic/amphiphilic exporter-1